MTVLESPVSMQNQGGASNASNIVSSISSDQPVQITPNNFQQQRFVSFDINSYQKLVNIPRPTNSFLAVQPGPLQQLVPIQTATSGGSTQQYVHLQLPNVQQGTNFIQLPVATTQIANIATNTNGIESFQQAKQAAAASTTSTSGTSVHTLNPQQFSIQLVQQPVSSNQTLTGALTDNVKSVGVPIQLSSGLNLRPMLISNVVTMAQTSLSTTTTSVTGTTLQAAPMLQIKQHSSKESVSNLVNIHPVPISSSQLSAKTLTTCPSSPKTIKILPSAVSSVSSSLFKALQEVANAPVKSPANTRLPLNNVQTILTNLTPNQSQQLNIQQGNLAPFLPQQQNTPQILVEKTPSTISVGQQATKTDDFATKTFPGTIMMVNPGQALTGKQQFIIPSSTQNQSMPMFVPITMANNVSVLTNQGSGDRVGQFGPGTTLRIQTQLGPLSSSSTNASGGGTSVTINPSNQKFLIPVRSLDSIAPKVSTTTITATTSSMSNVTINPGNLGNQKFLIPIQPSSLQQQYVLQTVNNQNLFTVSGGGIQINPQQPKQKSQILQQLQHQQQHQTNQVNLPDDQLQQQQLQQQGQTIQQQQLLIEHQLQQQQQQLQQLKGQVVQTQNPTTKFLQSQQNLQRIRQLQQQQQQQKQQQQQLQHQKMLNLQQKKQQKQHCLNQLPPDIQEQTPVLQCLQKKDANIPMLNKSMVAAKESTTTSITDSKPIKKPCNCTKSQCLKLYCECFANGEFCSNCNCRQCMNNISHEVERSKAIKTCLERNPYAFHPKIGKGKIKGDNERRHTKGCNCKRSGCLKNYCECYEAKILCSSLCKCSGCKNFEESADRKTLMHLADAAEVRVLQQNAAKTKLNIVQKKPSAPGKDKLPFTFMTEDVSKATCDILLAHVQESELANCSEVDTEESLIEEFSRCLNQIIEKSVNVKKGKKR